TKIKHKAVDLGTVRNVTLSADLQHVDVTVSMTAAAARVLTDDARFWVVRARFAPGNVSGLDTLLSGSYIEMDPGATKGAPQRHFT
ncbi:MlaD family protein, partial [Staphylococcus aureus]